MNIVNTKGKSPFDVYNILKKYDVVSFDIFDTLIFRPFYDPKDLFRTLSEKYNCLNFYQERINAEKLVRKVKMNKFGHYEVTLEEIYKELHKKLGIDVVQGCNNEVEKELECVYANPYMKKVFDLLQKDNKKIIMVSDMYLNNNYIKMLLNKCGYCKYDKIFVSCDYNANKRKGKLFEIVKDQFSDKNIIHIGDKYEVDYLKPLEYGIDSLLYIAPNSISKKKYNMTASIASLYNGIIYNSMYNGLNNEKFDNDDYRYGYEYSGIFVLGYVNWIHKCAKEKKLDKILFLSRDGYILKKVYDILFDDIPSEYVLWSRYASLKISPEKDFSRFIWQFVNRKVSKDKTITVKDLMVEMGIEFLKPKLMKVGIYEDSLLKYKRVRDIFILTLKDNSDLIFENSKKYAENAKEYYWKVVDDCKRVGIVDIGYRASGAISLINLFKDWEFNVDAKAIIAFGIVNKNSFDDTLVLNDEVISYVFSNGINKDLYFDNDKLMLDMSVIEILLTAAPKPSFLYFSRDNKNNILPVYEEENTVNYDRINNLHDGIVDFSVEYKRRIGNNEYLLNIPGYDSYLPIKTILDNKKNMHYFLKDFGTYVYSYMVSSTSQSVTVFADIYKEYKVKNSYISKLKKYLRKIKKYLKKKLKCW